MKTKDIVIGEIYFAKAESIWGTHKVEVLAVRQPRRVMGEFLLSHMANDGVRIRRLARAWSDGKVDYKEYTDPDEIEVVIPAAILMAWTTHLAQVAEDDTHQKSLATLKQERTQAEHDEAFVESIKLSDQAQGILIRFGLKPGQAFNAFAELVGTFEEPGIITEFLKARNRVGDALNKGAKSS